MSGGENSQAQERTEQPTPRRLQQAREKGQVARSRELNTMGVMLAGAGYLLLFGGWMFDRLQQLVAERLALAGRIDPTTPGLVAALTEAIVSAVTLLAPMLGVLCVAAFVGPAMLGGVVLSAEAARPKFERLNPISGLKRIFSLQGLMELMKTLLKFAVLVGIALTLLGWLLDDLLALSTLAPVAGMLTAAGYVQIAFLTLAGGLILIAAVDAPYQLWNHFKQLRMTRQEVKDEMKETDGNPEVRGKLRRQQQEIASRRMMEHVPHADVVITNPTHFAVALAYSDRPDRAPRVVAKGRELVAARIREIAEANGVTICSAPPLARALYHSTEIGAEIPAGLYLAVARVLAYVFQLDRAQGPGDTPVFPEDLPIPDEFHIDGKEPR